MEQEIVELWLNLLGSGLNQVLVADAEPLENYDERETIRCAVICAERHSH